jgi:hypothetical protein
LGKVNWSGRTPLDNGDKARKTSLQLVGSCSASGHREPLLAMTLRTSA